MAKIGPISVCKEQILIHQYLCQLVEILFLQEVTLMGLSLQCLEKHLQTLRMNQHQRIITN